MKETLTLQYQLITSARHVLFAYCKSLQPNDLLKPVPEFNSSSINSLLIHNANTYIHWLAKSGMKKPYSYLDDSSGGNMESIEEIFVKIDAIVADFLNEFEQRLEVISAFNVPGKDVQLNLSPLQLFTHVITHEFHHKGQILSMSRVLGYTPIDTDVIRS